MTDLLPFVIASLITVLSGPVGPTAISWFVVPERVDAIKRESCRASAHVGDELSKVVPPAVAHGYALGSVTVIPPMVWVMASRLSVFPRAPFLCRCSVDSMPMGCELPSCALASAAAATAGAAREQRACLDQLLCSTYASAYPSWLTSLWPKRQCGPQPERAPSEFVYQWSAATHRAGLAAAGFCRSLSHRVTAPFAYATTVTAACPEAHTIADDEFERNQMAEPQSLHWRWPHRDILALTV